MTSNQEDDFRERLRTMPARAVATYRCAYCKAEPGELCRGPRRPNPEGVHAARLNRISRDDYLRGGSP